MTIVLTDYKKISVIGISGTGKSTFSRKLAAMAKFPLYHMDSIVWSENWTESDDQSIRQTLGKISDTDSWIVEGWIGEYSKRILKQSDLIIYFDFPGWLAMWGVLQRLLAYRGKKRPELPNGCLENLKCLRIIFGKQERPHIEAILAEFKPKNILRVTSRSEAKQLLCSL